MTKIRVYTRYTIDLWSGKPVTIEYKDWGNKTLDHFVFTPKGWAPSYSVRDATEPLEHDVKIYILQSGYREWFGNNNGGDREITVDETWYNRDWNLISPGTPGSIYSSRFEWHTQVEWENEFREYMVGAFRDSVFERKLKGYHCNGDYEG
ncbi:hypothetical protein BU23DRAFT_573436 [Bimuria novae-zelandiae CBS 107.79]|uniref:Uncharacterized protein n=1 Tax=Bimuria novae-zelandiae CBS 107.79 TaxID=1447943 RepID=A0A6A5UTU7_9PLEO|nr:hypothetical protein BU23DRAFT_573436 [Bimuria novae-zelandiae CBS 107.79]